jgi:dTDP-4-amino-4,6-dideoxygalactose transaminase
MNSCLVSSGRGVDRTASASLPVKLETKNYAPATGTASPSLSLPFNGNMSIAAAHIFGKVAESNYLAWFAGANVAYVHAARTGIRKAISLLNLRAGDEVLFPAYHCGSELDPLLQAGVQVQLFRVSGTAEIDFADLHTRISSRTKAIYVIHYFGFAQSLSQIVELCRSRGLHLIEDCALSTFTRVDGQRIGGRGDVAVYNFPKVLPVPDGGALVINNPNLRPRVWSLKSSPMVSVWNNALRLLVRSMFRHTPNRPFRFRISEAPLSASSRLQMPRSYYFNLAMIDRGMSLFSGWVMGRTDLTEVILRRRENYSLLLDRISEIPGVKPLLGKLPDGVCPLCLPVVVRQTRKVARKLRACSVPAIAWWSGYHRAPLNWSDFPEACHLKDHVLALPIHQQLDAHAMDFISRKLMETVTATHAQCESDVIAN